MRQSSGFLKKLPSSVEALLNRRQPQLWLNPDWRPIQQARAALPLGVEAVNDAADGWLINTDSGREYLARRAIDGHLEAATHILWTTGGEFVPMEERLRFYERGQREWRAFTGNGAPG